MDKLILKAEKRKIFGRKVKKMRKAGILPANIYGKNIKSEAIETNVAEFNKTFKVAGETGLVELHLGNLKKPVLIHNIQVDPIDGLPIHADFLQVDLKQKVTAKVHIELVGESPAEKQGLGTVVQYLDEIEVEALPADLPEKFEIDLTKLENVEDMYQIKNFKIDKSKVELKVNPEEIVVKVEPPRKEEEVIVAKEEEIVAEKGKEAVTESQEEVKEEKVEEKTSKE